MQKIPYSTKLQQRIRKINFLLFPPSSGGSASELNIDLGHEKSMGEESEGR
jgi:hypothetical protein